MSGMTDFPDTHRDLLDAQVASLATVGRDGFPQVTEIWFLHDDGEIKLSLNTARVKTRNMQRDPKCSLLVLDLENPYRYLEVRGTARIEPDDDLTFARRLGAKYDTEFWVHDGPGESRVVITVEPVRIRTWPPE
jgi:PPOX class probable F420-dependent enzyme